MMETGRRPASGVDVAAYLAGCGPLDRPEYTALVALAKEPDTGHWLRPHSPELPDELRSLIIAESMASSIACYEPLVVPGLLQTEDYVRELFRWGSSRPEQEIEVRVRARLARQDLLNEANPPACTFFISEHALGTVVGSAGVMSEQILHLVLASHDGRCVVRVVPDAAGPFGSIGMFRLMHYADYSPVAYSETWTSGLFIEQQHEVALYQQVQAKLDSAALDAGQSRAWLADLASAYDRVEAESTCPPARTTG